jgi:hypothetical protein
MQKSRTVDHGRDDVVCGNFGESSALSTSLKRLIIENPEKFLDSSIMAIYRRLWDMVDQVLEGFGLPVQALSVLASVYSSPKIRLTRNQALELFSVAGSSLECIYPSLEIRLTRHPSEERSQLPVRTLTVLPPFPQRCGHLTYVKKNIWSFEVQTLFKNELTTALHTIQISSWI